MELQYLWNMIGCEERIAIPQSNEGAMLGTGDQFQFGFEHDRARTFCSDECARDVESSFRQQLIQVVAGDPSRNLRESRADKSSVVLLDCAQSAVNLAAAAALSNDLSQFRFARRAYRHLRAVVKQDSQLFDVVDRFPTEQRMCPARIVPVHSTARAAIVW